MIQIWISLGCKIFRENLAMQLCKVNFICTFWRLSHSNTHTHSSNEKLIKHPVLLANVRYTCVYWICLFFVFCYKQIKGLPHLKIINHLAIWTACWNFYICLTDFKANLLHQIVHCLMLLHKYCFYFGSHTKKLSAYTSFNFFSNGGKVQRKKARWQKCVRKTFKRNLDEKNGRKTCSN
jgi:hypothetical protein